MVAAVVVIGVVVLLWLGWQQHGRYTNSSHINAQDNQVHAEAEAEAIALLRGGAAVCVYTELPADRDGGSFVGAGRAEYVLHAASSS
jgi:hypothetical protein